MKNIIINQKLNQLTHPNLSVAIALACGFWISQFVAWAFVGTILGAAPSLTGLLSASAVLLFFLIRAPNSQSRLPAILGLCSSAMLLSIFGFAWYFLLGSTKSVELYLLLALGLAFSGVVIDVERYWHLIVRPAKSNQVV